MFSLSLVSAAIYGLVAAAPTYLLKRTVDDIFVPGNQHLIVPMALALVALFAAKGICSFVTAYSMHWVGYRVVNAMRSDLFASIMRYPLSAFKEFSTGRLMSYFLSDIQMIQNVASSAIKNGIRSLFETLFLVAFAFMQNWKLALMMVIVGPVMGYIVKRMGKTIKKSARRIQEEVASMSQQLQETFTGIREVKTFNAEGYHIERFKNQLGILFKTFMKFVTAEALLPALIELVTMGGAALAFYVAAMQVVQGQITPGQLTSFVAAALLAYAPMKRLINVYGEIQAALAAANRVFTLIDRVEPAHVEGLVARLPFNREIRFQDVTFAYEEGRPVFTGANFSIKKGERVGIIGPSGAGKSTIIDLILGFITPTQGVVAVDAEKLMAHNSAAWREDVGCVAQRSFLFNATVGSNVAYGRDAVTNERVNEVLRAADARSFVDNLPHGIETVLGENGNLLSGGQRQRITIARALAGLPGLVIFDEATAALDYESEEEIKKSLRNFARDVTVIVVTHRASLLESVDRVLLVANRMVTEVDKNSAGRVVAV